LPSREILMANIEGVTPSWWLWTVSERVDTLSMAVIDNWESTHSFDGQWQPLRERVLSWWLLSAIKGVYTLLTVDIGHQGSTHSLDGQYRPSRDECVPLDGWYWLSREYTLSWWPILAIQESVYSLDGPYSIDPLWWRLPAIKTQFADFMGYIQAIINP
jgi:hypothetical protein